MKLIYKYAKYIIHLTLTNIFSIKMFVSFFIQFQHFQHFLITHRPPNINKTPSIIIHNHGGIYNKSTIMPNTRNNTPINLMRKNTDSDGHIGIIGIIGIL